jgi:uncharacterized protein
MTKFPSRFRRLDQILADLPVEDPMLLTELDGYLTAIVVCPEAISSAFWMPPIWDGLYGEEPPFEDPIDAQLFGEMVKARQDEIERDLARGRPRPIFDVEPSSGEVVWEDWVGGFEMALRLHPDHWTGAIDDDDDDPLAAMISLADVAFDRSSLPGDDINMICDAAPDAIPAIVMALYAGRARPDISPPSLAKPAKLGRNDPCPCGSGKKAKRCCAAA